MKSLRSFDKFLEDEVSLNKSRLDRIEDGIRVVTNFLQNNEFFKHYFLEDAEGSYRQGTGMKPQKDRDDFDVDVLFRMSLIDDWEP